VSTLHIVDHKTDLLNKRIFIGSDAQSILKALKVGPHRSYHYVGIDTSPLWKRMYEIMTFCKELVIQYIPGHIDIEGNTYADNSAKHAATHYTTIQQN
jgi:ribonuclease HI